MIFRLILSFALLSPLLCQSQNDSVSDGKKQGKWIFRGKEKPSGIPIESRMNHVTNGHRVNYTLDSIKISEGDYENDMKSGLWMYYFKDGISIKMTEMYTANRLDGPYEKFWENGELKESGYYEKGKRMTLMTRNYSSGCLEYIAHYDENGREEGSVSYYYDCDSLSTEKIGQLEFQYTAKSGIPQGKATRYFKDSKIHELLEYGLDGKLITRDKREQE